MGGIVKARGKELLYELDKGVDCGDLNRQYDKDSPLSIYCYSNNVMYNGNWTKINQLARGLVVDRNTGEIKLKSMEKFFNESEKFCHPPKRPDYMSFEKIDGSLLNFINYEGKIKACTKGSFDNEYIDFGMKYSHLLEPMPKDYTVITEVVLPSAQDGMRRAINHEPGLYLIGLTDMKDLSDKPIGTMYGTWNGFFPKTYKNSVDELIMQANEEVGTEGWVVRYSNGFRMKIKTAWYLKIFRLINKLDSRVQDEMLAGKDLNEILLNVPEELHKDITAYYGIVDSWVCEKLNKIQENYNTIGLLETRKDFAQAISNNPDKTYLFKLYDNKLIKQDLVKLAIKEGMS